MSRTTRCLKCDYRIYKSRIQLNSCDLHLKVSEILRFLYNLKSCDEQDIFIHLNIYFYFIQ